MPKKLGMIREIDSVGRYVIPKEYRKILGINYNDKVECYVENDCIILKKYVEEETLEEHLKKYIQSIQENKSITVDSVIKHLIGVLNKEEHTK